MSTASYPWYGVVEGDEIEQGDLFEDCPVFLPPADLALSATTKATNAKFEYNERDLIVLSQSCDLAKGRTKVEDVLLCAVWKRSEVKEGHLASEKGMEDARRGLLPAFHVSAVSDQSKPASNNRN